MRFIVFLLENLYVTSQSFSELLHVSEKFDSPCIAFSKQKKRSYEHFKTLLQIMFK